MASVRALIGRDPAEIVAAFRQDYPNASPAELDILIGSHGCTGVNTIKVAERRVAQHRAWTYAYVFGWETPVGGMRSPQTIEIPFVFDNLDLAAGMVGPVTLEMRRLADQVRGAWVAFARTGNPGHAGLPPWAPYEPRDRTMMFLDTICEIRNDPWSAERRALMAG